ncbi:RNA recognition motif domain-containing protein [Endozoicomonas sp.]|uniref:RNA recognition motif domain-containing protein n=1 Tax=Endozoicomonas sp. TaxID=1892382 RepID=UPI002885F1E7|nr:RNA-binding protein [Endozoicomonas sp.]
MQKRTLYIGNLAYTTVEEDLEQAFESFGEIEDIKLMRDRETDRSRGFAFITFEKESEAEAARAMDGQEVAGRPLRVNEAVQKQPAKRPQKKSTNNFNQ